MKKLSITLAFILIISSETASAYVCDGGDISLEVSPTVENTSAVVAAVIEKSFDIAETNKLFTAIKAKNLAAVKLVLKNNANPNAVLEKKPYLSVLSYAVDVGTPAILKAILDEGGDPNVTDKNSQATTPLIQACKQLNKNDFIDVLLDPAYTTDINKSAAGGRTPLHFASTNSNTAAITRLVIEPKIDLNSESPFVVGEGNDPLSSLSYFGNIAGMNAFLAHPETTQPVTVEHLDAAIRTINKSASISEPDKIIEREIVENYRTKQQYRAFIP